MATFILCLLALFSLPAQEEGMLQRIEWTGTPMAKGYRVEFYREGVEVFRKETPDTWLSFSLPPGIYTWRVTIINKFGKDGGQSDPQELIIEKIHTPLVKRCVPSEIWSDATTADLTIELYQLHQKGEIWLVQGDHRSRGEILLRAEDRVQVRFSLNGFEPGSCDLDLQNPAGVSSFARNILTIREKRTPLFRSLSENFLYAGSLYTDLRLFGSGFEEGLKVVFLDGSRELVPVQVTVLSDTEARLWLDLRNEKKGRFALRLDNPVSGRGSGGAEPVLTVDYTPEYYWKERNFGSDLLIGGVGFIVPEMGPDKEWVVLPGGSVKIDIDFTDKVPVLRGWCFEIRGDFAAIPSEEMQAAAMGVLAMMYRTRLYSRVNFFVKGGMGGQWTFGTHPQNGPVFIVAGGLDFNFFLHLIFQLEGGYWLFIHEGGSSSYFPVGLSIGYRF